MIIRRLRPADEPALYEICLRTGDSGEDATGQYADPDLLGHVYVGPYLRFAPDHAYVLDSGDRAVGYALGVSDTVAFAQQCARDWWPALRARYPDPAATPDHRRTPDQRLAELIHRPPEPPAEVTGPYPAHLHIDLLPAAQGQGCGPRMLRTVIDSLAAAGAAGVHLEVSAANHRAIKVYRRLGMVEVRRGPDSLVMARPLP